MKNSRKIYLLILICCIIVSCSEDKEIIQGPTYDIMLNETSFGTVLTDKVGRTLYFHSKDVNGASTCLSGCVDNWPIFSTTNSTFDPRLDPSKFGNIIRDDGTTQATFKGWPLYYSKLDVKAGDVKGENRDLLWYVAKTNYTVTLANKQLMGEDGKTYKADYSEGTGNTPYFTDPVGRTIYSYVNDKKNTNTFTKADFSNDGTWPIYTSDLVEFPSVVDKTLFGTIDVFGKKQLTYKGWPLYYYGADFKLRGSTRGISVPNPGVWKILNTETIAAPQ
tara:strand:- start:470 stop:1300 length:831 start_codon:yes stop_codon:yes gene_type:complete